MSRRRKKCEWCGNSNELHICPQICDDDGAMVPCGRATCANCLKWMFDDGTGGSRVRRLNTKTPEKCPHHHALAACDCSDCETRKDGPLTLGHFAQVGALKHVYMLRCGGCHKKTWQPCPYQVIHVSNPAALRAELRTANAEGYDISDIPDHFYGCKTGFDAKLFQKNGCGRLFCEMVAGTTQAAKPDSEFGEDPYTSRLGPVFSEVLATAAGEELIDDALDPEKVDDAAKEIEEIFDDDSSEFTEFSDDESFKSMEFTKEPENCTDDEMEFVDSEGDTFTQYADQYASSDEDLALIAFLPQPVPSEGKRPKREKRRCGTLRWNAEFVNQKRPDQTASSAPVHDCSDDDNEVESVWDLKERVTIKASQPVLTAEEEEREWLQTKQGSRRALLDKLHKEKEIVNKRRNELVLQAFGQKKGFSPSAKTKKRVKAFCAHVKIRILQRYARQRFRQLVPCRQFFDSEQIKQDYYERIVRNMIVFPVDSGQTEQDYYDGIVRDMFVSSALENVLSQVCDGIVRDMVVSSALENVLSQVCDGV